MTSGRATRSALAWCAIAALGATGCASTAELARQGRWYDVCERAEGGRHAAEAEVELRRWLDADLELGVIDEAQAEALLGEGNGRFARDHKLIAVKTRSRVIHPEWPATEQLSPVGVAGAVIDGRVYRASEHWVPRIDPGPPTREVDPGQTARNAAERARAFGDLAGALLGGPIKTSTFGATSFGVQEQLEDAGEAVAGGIETVGRIAAMLRSLFRLRRGGSTTPPRPRRVDPDAVNALLDERRCEVRDGRLECVSFVFLDLFFSRAGTPDALDVSYLFSVDDREKTCSRAFVLRTAIPPGESLGARLEAMFAHGPVRLVDLEPVDPDAIR